MKNVRDFYIHKAGGNEELTCVEEFFRRGLLSVSSIKRHPWSLLHVLILKRKMYKG